MLKLMISLKSKPDLLKCGDLVRSSSYICENLT